MTERLEFMKRLAWEAGQLSLEGHGRTEAIEKESPDGYDIVTEYDRRVEELVRERIAREFDEPVLGEEFGFDGDAIGERVWLIDPIDGTFNYRFGIPLYGVILSYCESRVPVAGAICLPALRELFAAAAGAGAWLHNSPDDTGREMRIRKEDDSRRMVFTVEGHCTPQVVAAYFAAGLPRRSLRSLMCAAVPLPYIGCGRMDAFLQTSLHVWDCAAGDLILRESGGPACVDEQGDPIFPKYLECDREVLGDKFVLVGAAHEQLRDRCLNLLAQAGVGQTPADAAS